MAAEPNFVNYLNLAVDAAKDAGRAVMRDAAREVVKDLERDVKVGADFCLNVLIGSKLVEQTPYPVLSEEDGDSQKRSTDDEYRWVVDPLDGSVNFSRGIPLCCISIAFCRGTEPVLGVVYDFNRDELFTGLTGTGAWLNGRQIKVSDVGHKAKAVLCTGFPVCADFSSVALMEFVHEIQAYKKVRLLGSAALSLAYVAMGRADVYQEDGIALWDVAAGLALVKAAGGIVSLRSTNIQNRFNVKAGNPFLLDNASSPLLKTSLR